MSKRFPISNVEIGSIFGMYVDESIDMNHFVARIQITSITRTNLRSFTALLQILPSSQPYVIKGRTHG